MISEGSLSSEVYSSGVDLFKNIFFSAYKEGIKDGSLKNLKNPEIFYFSTAHAMLELCKKLSAGNEIVKQDETTDKVAEITERDNTFLYREPASLMRTKNIKGAKAIQACFREKVV